MWRAQELGRWNIEKVLENYKILIIHCNFVIIGTQYVWIYEFPNLKNRWEWCSRTQEDQVWRLRVAMYVFMIFLFICKNPILFIGMHYVWIYSLLNCNLISFSQVSRILMDIYQQESNASFGVHVVCLALYIPVCSSEQH